uniref:Uncharacterized protein n=1 Tax=Trichobilharzia regenti TaxID=157069 RepID=A0AA85IY90_TRIRE
FWILQEDVEEGKNWMITKIVRNEFNISLNGGKIFSHTTSLQMFTGKFRQNLENKYKAWLLHDSHVYCKDKCSFDASKVRECQQVLW